MKSCRIQGVFSRAEEETLGEAEINHVLRVLRRETDRVYERKKKGGDAGAAPLFWVWCVKTFPCDRTRTQVHTVGFSDCRYEAMHRKRELRNTPSVSQRDWTMQNFAVLLVKTYQDVGAKNSRDNNHKKHHSNNTVIWTACPHRSSLWITKAALFGIPTQCEKRASTNVTTQQQLNRCTSQDALRALGPSLHETRQGGWVVSCVFCRTRTEVWMHRTQHGVVLLLYPERLNQPSVLRWPFNAFQ